MTNRTKKSNEELVSLLKAISEISEILGTKTNDKKYFNISQASKRMAELNQTGIPDEMIPEILREEGLINDYIFNTVKGQNR